MGTSARSLSPRFTVKTASWLYAPASSVGLYFKRACWYGFQAFARKRWSLTVLPASLRFSGDGFTRTVTTPRLNSSGYGVSGDAVEDTARSARPSTAPGSSFPT